MSSPVRDVPNTPPNSSPGQYTALPTEPLRGESRDTEDVWERVRVGRFCLSAQRLSEGEVHAVWRNSLGGAVTPPPSPPPGTTTVAPFLLATPEDDHVEALREMEAYRASRADSYRGLVCERCNNISCVCPLPRFSSLTFSLRPPLCFTDSACESSCTCCDVHHDIDHGVPCFARLDHLDATRRGVSWWGMTTDQVVTASLLVGSGLPSTNTKFRHVLDFLGKNMAPGDSDYTLSMRLRNEGTTYIMRQAGKKAYAALHLLCFQKRWKERFRTLQAYCVLMVELFSKETLRYLFTEVGRFGTLVRVLFNTSESPPAMDMYECLQPTYERVNFMVHSLHGMYASYLRELGLW